MVRAYSSGVEHYVDIVGVPSSNLGTPTIVWLNFSAKKPVILVGFLLYWPVLAATLSPHCIITAAPTCTAARLC